RRIKSEIHDGVAQALGYLNLKTKLVEELVSSNIMDRAIEGLADIGKVVRETYENIRESIDQLSTEAETFNLDSALPNYVKEFSGNTGIQVRFETSAEIQKISPVAGLQLMRIVQEALTNVRKHAGAKHVQVRLQHDQRNIVLTVKDDGQGFEKVPGENQESQGGSHGLTIMNERTESLGGTFSIVSTEGGGTEVTVCFPLEKVRI
ncbi:MAG: sensor histidine kinase, partial [Dehalococcoidia bacterium]|nr:sensor histidine kinase [Dehalococcoidia bacterium]